MSHYEIRGIALEWFQSYLTGRTQFVEYNDTKSETLHMSCGVLQGSNLGPLLFLLYINDLAFVSPKLFAILFADDSNFFCSGRDLSSVIETVNHELIYVVNWLNANKMSLNIDKTHFMIFHSKKKKVHTTENVKIMGINISRVEYTKFLGVIIDSTLSWQHHIDYISTKISKNIGIIRKARKIFTDDTILSLYYSFIYPYLNYCIHVWGSATNNYLNKIVILQKRIIRIVCGVNRTTHSEPLFNRLSVLTLSKLYMYNIGLLMYKHHHNQLPQILNLFLLNSDIHSHNTRSAGMLHVPKFNTEFGKRSFRFQAVKIWNDIYLSVSVNIKIGTFKKNLKSYLIEKTTV